MKKIVILVVVLFLLVFGIVALFYAKDSLKLPEIKLGSNLSKKTAKVQIADKADLTAELAQTAEEKAKGLSGREKLNEDEGMLFVFDDYFQPAFWMKDMLIPIDIIWIRDEKIVDITENILPPEPNTAITDLQTYLPKEGINYVLEVPAGFASSHNIQIGDIINFKF